MSAWERPGREGDDGGACGSRGGGGERACGRAVRWAAAWRRRGGAADGEGRRLFSLSRGCGGRAPGGGAGASGAGNLREAGGCQQRQSRPRCHPPASPVVGHAPEAGRAGTGERRPRGCGMRPRPARPQTPRTPPAPVPRSPVTVKWKAGGPRLLGGRGRARGRQPPAPPPGARVGVGCRTRGQGCVRERGWSETRGTSGGVRWQRPQLCASAGPAAAACARATVPPASLSIPACNPGQAGRAGGGQQQQVPRARVCLCVWRARGQGGSSSGRG